MTKDIEGLSKSLVGVPENLKTGSKRGVSVSSVGENTGAANREHTTCPTIQTLDVTPMV